MDGHSRRFAPKGMNCPYQERAYSVCQMPSLLASASSLHS